MTDQLKQDLENLLKAHPELKSKTLSFTSDSATLLPDQETPVCHLREEPPATIAGPSAQVKVHRSPVHGYGIFAAGRIAEGELIEECRLLKLGWRQGYLKDPVLSDYIWANNNCACAECKEHGFYVYLALGLGSLYNHANVPNTKHHLNFKAEMMTITAKRDIEAGEEIFVSYGNKYFLVREFWKKVEQNGDFEKKLLEMRNS